MVTYLWLAIGLDWLFFFGGLLFYVFMQCPVRVWSHIFHSRIPSLS